MIRKWALFFSVVSLLFIGGLFLFLTIQSVPIWLKEGFHFIFGTHWYYRHESFGILPMVYGTFVVSFLAILFAGPIGIGTATFISEFTHGKLRMSLKVLIEMLAGIPSVVYGLIGILVLRPWISFSFNTPSGDTLLTAGLLLGIMILPTIVSLCDEALQDIPKKYRSASLALGLSKEQMIFSTIYPMAKKGILSSLLLGLGRGMGETIAIFLVIGRADNRLPETLFSTQSLFKAGQTLTSKLGGSEVNIAYGDPQHWGAICAIGLILLISIGALYLLGEMLFIRKEKNEIPS